MSLIPKGFGGYAKGKFGITVFNAQSCIKKLNDYGVKRQSLVLIAVKRSLIMLEAESIRLITGNVYWKNPIDTGRMKNSITHKLVSFSYTKIEGKVGTNVYYAIYVHEGTKHMSYAAAKAGSIVFNMGKRPFLTDALRNKKDAIIKEVIDAYKKEIYR